MENKELKHVGVLGMKWGRRRAQRQSNDLREKARTAESFGLKKLGSHLSKKADEKQAKAKELDTKIKEKRAARAKKDIADAKRVVKDTNTYIDAMVKLSVSSATKKGKDPKKAAEKARKDWDEMMGTTYDNEITLRKNRRKIQDFVENTLSYVGGQLV
jgi:hypothetical protein